MDELDVVVLGGAALDWVAQLEKLPPKDGLAVAYSCAQFPGGSAANVAVGIARFGYQVGFVGKLGNDENGQLLLRAFEQDSVDTRATVVEADRSTAICFVGLDDQGERIIFALPGASIIETVAELDLGYMSGSRVLYIGPAYTEVATAAATAARKRGATVFYAPGGAWGAEKLASIQPILELADVLLVSHTEATVLTAQTSPTEAIRSLGEVGPPVVIVTLGEQGALVRAKGRVIQVRAPAVSVVRDTTGAGDAFAAGLIAGFLEGLDWAAAARLGNAVAALKIQHVGARSGLPTRDEVADYMRSLQEGRCL